LTISYDKSHFACVISV